MTDKNSKKPPFFSKIRPRKVTITGKFLVVLLCSGFLAVFCFMLFYRYRDATYFLLYDQGFLNHHREEWIEEFITRAKEVSIAPNYQDKLQNKQLMELMNLRDYYSGIILYEHDTGTYITAIYPTALDSGNLIWRLAGGMSAASQVKMDQHTTIEKTVEFQDQVADVYFFSYHHYSFYSWYLLAALLLSILVFLTPNLIFLHRKAKEIKVLKNEILYMAEGNLERTVTAKSRDEIGILATQLDYLRQSLKDTIEEERESREANSDLIRAMSHDLRTPLTILSGYLEIVKLHRGDTAMEEQYLDSCLNKALEIRELSDRMFEYAMVYETQEELEMEAMAVSQLLKLLWENMNFMELAGFTVDKNADSHWMDVKELGGPTFWGNPLALKRVLNNLFSNILKYGDKAHPVKVAFSIEQGHWRLALSNHIRQSHKTVESNHIGLKSVEKIIELHGGSVYSMQVEDVFSVEVMV